MGSEVCADEQVIPIPPPPPMCANQRLISSKVVVEGDKEAAAAAAAAGPATPEAEEKGGGDHHFSSPPPPPWANYSDNETALETPKETLFDSFAPASDKFLLAPYHRKYRDESRTHVVRRLDFTKDVTFTRSCDEQQEEEKDEERIFEIVYGTIMDAILAEQGKKVAYQSGGTGGGTPKSAPFLNGIADTCPAAPLKSARKHRFIDKEICKKLEF